MMTYIVSLIGLSLLCVLWIVFQGWLARQDAEYKGYQAGCGGCSRSCGDKNKKSQQQGSSCDDDLKDKVEKVKKMHFIDASAVWSKHQDMK